MKKILLLIFITTVILTTSSCTGDKTVKVAVMTVLESGSIVGSSEIDALRLYIKEHNIKNVEVIPFNDGWDPEKIPGVYKEIRKQGIDIIFTSHTSTCAIELKKLTDLEKDDVIVFVTGSTTDELSNIDDNNIRVIQDVEKEQMSIANYISSNNYKKLMIVRDLDNNKYTEPALKYFLENYTGDYEYMDISIKNINTQEIEDKFKNTSFDALYTLIGGNQTASGTIGQLAYILNPDVTIYFTPWNNASTILETSGESINSSVMANHYDVFDNQGVMQMISNFKDEYGYPPTYNSVHLYRSFDIFMQSLRAGNRKPTDIKNYIIQKGEFETPFGNIKFNEFGDTDMDLYFIHDIRGAF